MHTYSVTLWNPYDDSAWPTVRTKSQDTDIWPSHIFFLKDFLKCQYIITHADIISLLEQKENSDYIILQELWLIIHYSYRQSMLCESVRECGQKKS